MPALRALALAALLAFVLSGLALAQAPAEWYTDTGGGGVLAQPAGESESGGAMSPPMAAGTDEGPESDISATPPISSAAQAEPVLGAPAEEPAPAPPAPPAPRAAQDAPTVTGGQEQEGEESGPIASLPLTGLELGVLAGAGLCLLIAGTALRPRRAV